MNPRITSLAALLPFIHWLPASAEPASDLDPIIVTASRFAEADPQVPANITVITRDDIRRSPARNLPDLLKASAGLNVVPLYGSLGIDTTVDLRGFGDSAGSNTLVLLDGQRLSPIDMGSVSWSAVPLEGIQRIEIIRGSGTVLYGDRATGGVINIITDKSGKERASLTATAGSNDARGVDGQLSGGNGKGYYNLSAHYANTDGWRENTQAEQHSMAGRAGLYLGNGEGFVDYALYKDSSGLPGSISEAIYRSNPRTARTPFDSQRREGYRLRPGISLPLSPTLDLEAELSVEHEDYHANNVSFASTFDRQRDMVSLTPRLRWRHGLGGLNSETVAGLDYYSGKVDNSFSSFAGQTAKQISSAAYLQNTTALTSAWSLTVGGRSQRMDQRARQEAFPLYFMSAMTGGAVRTRNAWDAGLTYLGDGWRAYGKAGTTFRFANTDELFGLDPFTGNPVFAGDLKPQRGSLREIGASFTHGTLGGRLSLYDLRLTDEIGYDGAAFANVNFDPTRRQGLESEFDWRLASSLKAKLTYTYAEASFRSGAFDGRQIPLVPRNKAAFEVDWDSGSAGSYTALLNYVGERPYSGDFANARKKLAGYTTLDLLASWNLKPWIITARVLNATDQRYAPFALYAPSRGDYYYYPADGRSYFLTARYDFK